MGFSGVRVPQYLVFCVVVCRSLSLVLFLFANALSVFHRLTGSDYPFDIFKLHLIYAQRLFKTLLLQIENIPFIVCIDEFAV